MPTCNECGAFVSTRFTRVFGNNQDQVYGCHNCKPTRALTNGVASEE